MGKKNTNYNIIKAASWYTIGNIVAKSISFFVLPVFTSLMNTTEYGIYSVYLSYLAIFEVVVLLGLSSTIRIARYDKEIDFSRYMSTVICIPVVETAFIALFLNLYLKFFNMGSLLSMNHTLWNYLLITSASSAISGIIGAKLVIDAKYREYMCYSAINAVLNACVSLLLCYTVYKNHDIHMARVVGQCVASLGSTAFLMIVTKTRPAIDGIYVKKSLIWGIPLLFHTLATVVLTQSDRIVIRYMDSYAAAGIYSIAVTLITIPLTLQTSLESAWAPWFYRKMDEKDYKSIRKVNDLYIIIFGIIIAEFMLVSPEIIHIFTNRDYWDSIYCLIPLSISVFGEMLYCLPVNVEYYNKKTKYIMWGTVSVTLINILLDIGFVYIWGFVGAAYATAVSKLLLFLFHFILSKKIDKNPVFNCLTAFTVIVALFGFNCLIIASITYIIPRWIVCIAIAGILIYFLIKNKKIFKE